MIRLPALLACLAGTPVLADQSYDALALAELFNRVALAQSAPIHPTNDTTIERVAIAECILQRQQSFYAPSKQTITFVVLTHDIGAITFETNGSGRRYTFADYADEPNRARLDYRVTPPTAKFNKQTHPLDVAAPLRAAIPTAWSVTETFGVSSIIMVGNNLAEDHIIALLDAFDAYQATYCAD